MDKAIKNGNVFKTKPAKSGNYLKTNLQKVAIT